MSSYLYDDILNRHFEKIAFWGAMASKVLPRVAGFASKKFLPTAAKEVGKFGIGYATGVPIGGSGIAGSIAGGAKDILGSVNRPNVGPSIAGYGFGGSGAQSGSIRTASLREKTSQETKKAFGLSDVGHGALHYGPYLGFIGSHALEHKYPKAALALSLASLGTLGGSSIHDIHKDPKNVSNYLDLGAAGLWTLGDSLRLRKLLKGELSST